MRQETSNTIWQGIIAGLIGYATIALAVGAGDVMQGRSFLFTVSLLGEWMFYGLQDPADATVWAGPVFAYNGLHLVTFLAFGLLSSWMASVSEKGPLFWYGALVMYIFVFVHMFGAVALMTEPLRVQIPMLQIVVPSLLAVAAMSVYLLVMHPQVRHEMEVWTDDTERDPVPTGGPAAR